MIYTVTAAPSLDYIMCLQQLAAGQMNRATATRIVPGGKGVNVSIMLCRMGVPSRALGFAGGAVGEAIVQMLETIGCETDFIRLQNVQSRLNVKLRADTETEINAAGPAASAAAMEALLDQIRGLDAADGLVLSGAAPQGASPDFYARMLRAAPQGVCTVVDTAGEQMTHALPLRPFLIKPNVVELAALLGGMMRDEADLLEGAQQLRAQGARNVLVSRGGAGALLVAENGKTYRGLPPCGEAVNTVGAGDSMVAGFLAGWRQTNCYEDALRMGLAAGSATAFDAWLATEDAVARCLTETPAIAALRR